MTKEQWLAVVGYEGYYEVSNFGRVRSVRRLVRSSKGKNSMRISLPHVLSQGQSDHYGRLLVSLSKKGYAKSHLVHRLVLFAFVGPCPKGMECRHFPDRDPTNNHIDNLSWSTHAQNMKDQDFHQTRNYGVSRGEKNGNSKLTVTIAKQIRQLYQSNNYTQIMLATMFGISQALVSRLINYPNLWHIEAE